MKNNMTNTTQLEHEELNDEQDIARNSINIL